MVVSGSASSRKQSDCRSSCKAYPRRRSKLWTGNLIWIIFSILGAKTRRKMSRHLWPKTFTIKWGRLHLNQIKSPHNVPCKWRRVNESWPAVHFNQKCLKEYLHRKHNVQVEEFQYESIIIDRTTLNMLTDEECACLSSYGLHIQWSLYFVLLVLNTLNDEITAWVLLKFLSIAPGCLIDRRAY